MENLIERARIVQKFYDDFAPQYDQNRYQSPEQSLIDQAAQKIFLKLTERTCFAGLKILDVGCGTGRLAKLFSERGADVLGIDPSETMLSTARKKVPGALFQKGNVLNLKFYETFDMVVCSQVLTHLHQYQKPLQEMKKALKQNGAIIIDIRNSISLKNLFALLRQKLVKSAIENDYKPHFTNIFTIKRLCKKIGLRVTQWGGLNCSGKKIPKIFQQTLIIKMVKD